MVTDRRMFFNRNKVEYVDDDGIAHIMLTDRQARMRGMNPVWRRKEPALMMGKSVILPAIDEWFSPQCETCDEYDENMDNAPHNLHNAKYLNGNKLIEFPKQSKKFHCPCCFQNNMSDAVVSRVLGDWWVLTPEYRRGE